MKIATVVGIIVFVYIRGSSSDEWEFPDDFQFGAATSAYQIEGGWDADGKGVSVWDRLTHTPGFVADGSTGDVACDSYHKWKEDVQMLKNLNVNFYRFSMSWTRIFPNGFANGVNQPGVDYYNNLINELLANGIEPIVTLFHWDLPDIFTPLGGFYTPNFIDLYANYARTAFNLFGDRVKKWITFNEPKVVCQDYNEFMGTINDVYPNGIIEYLCSHNIIRAHVKAFHIYDREFRFWQGGKVGITLNFEWSEPATDSQEDIAAAEQRRQFEFGLYANPVVYGNYPQIVIDRVEERSLNHYNSWLVRATVESPIGKPSVQKDIGTSRHVDPEWQDTELGGKLAPWGLRNSLQWLKKTYRDPEILITECGYPDETGTLEDSPRINYLRQYLNATLQAIYEDNVNVKAFTVWSLMDNLEWGQGYTVKMGLYQVDFNSPNRTRTPKQSAEYFRNVIRSRRV